MLLLVYVYRKGYIMRLAICDDEATVITLIKSYVLEYFQENEIPVPEIITFSDGESLIQDMSRIDIVFLDIQMPGLDGIHAGQQIAQRYPDSFIFVITSFMEYLDDAMRFHVFRYLQEIHSPIARLLARFYETWSGAATGHMKRRGTRR